MLHNGIDRLIYEMQIQTSTFGMIRTRELLSEVEKMKIHVEYKVGSFLKKLVASTVTPLETH